MTKQKQIPEILKSHDKLFIWITDMFWKDFKNDFKLQSIHSREVLKTLSNIKMKCFPKIVNGF